MTKKNKLCRQTITLEDLCKFLEVGERNSGRGISFSDEDLKTIKTFERYVHSGMSYDSAKKKIAKYVARREREQVKSREAELEEKKEQDKLYEEQRYNDIRAHCGYNQDKVDSYIRDLRYTEEQNQRPLYEDRHSGWD